MGGVVILAQDNADYYQRDGEKDVAEGEEEGGFSEAQDLLLDDDWCCVDGLRFLRAVGLSVDRVSRVGCHRFLVLRVAVECLQALGSLVVWVNCLEEFEVFPIPREIPILCRPCVFHFDANPKATFMCCQASLEPWCPRVCQMLSRRR